MFTTLIVLLFAVGVIVGRLYGTAEFAKAAPAAGRPATPAWRLALARCL